MSRNEIVADVDLINAVQDAMKRRGLFSKLKAQVRAEVYHILEDKSVVMPEKPQDVFVASELVKEFLSLLGLKNTLSVFCEEMGQPREMAVDRGVIGAELGLNTLGTEPTVPLLMMIVEHLKRSRMDYIAHDDTSVHADVDAESVDEEAEKEQREREYKLFLQEQKIKQQQEQLDFQRLQLQQQQQDLMEAESRLRFQQVQQPSQPSTDTRIFQSEPAPAFDEPPSSRAPISNQLPSNNNRFPSNPSEAGSDTIFSLMNKNRYIADEDNDQLAFDDDPDSYADDQFDD